MLLYEQDYNTHAGIFDYETKNVSAIRVAILLKKMGIQNNKFMLYLSQKELQGVDPYSPNLTQEQCERIAYEIKTNFWYYIREIIKVPSAGGDAISYQFNRANLALNWCFLNSFDSYLTEPRQTGKTVGVMGLTSYLFFFKARNSNLGLFAKDSTLVNENVARLKEIRNSLPDYLIASKRDTDNQEGLTYKALGNKYTTYLGPADRKRAASTARGQSFIFEHWDEFAYITNNDKAYPAATSCMDKASEQAKILGIPTCNLITTTAGRLSDESGKYAFQIKSNCMRFNEKIYDCVNRDEVEHLLNVGSISNMFYLEYSYKDLGKDDVWFARVTKNKNQVEIATDYLNQWQLGAGDSIVPIALLNRLNDSIKEPDYYSNQGSLSVRWYIPKDIILSPEYVTRNYLIGLDTSDNVGSDFTTIVISDPVDLAVVATCRCNISNLVNVVTCIYELMILLPNSILIPERNKNGAMLIDILIDMMLKKRANPFYRIYNTFIQEYNSDIGALSDIDLSNGTNRKRFGFTTTSGKDSRNILYGRVLINMLNYMANRLHDVDLASEIKSLTVRNGRVDHAVGQHDDMCISWLLTGFFAFYGKNHHMYGIPRGEILKGVNKDGEHVDLEAKNKQIAIRKRIGELKGLIVTTANNMLKTTYERELIQLEPYLDDSLVDDMISVNQVKTMANDIPTAIHNATLMKNLHLYF